MPEKVLVAMSGGVDSTVSALLLENLGYECIGANMRLFSNEDAGISSYKSCCSLDDVQDARAAAFRLGMRFYVFNMTDDFSKTVIDDFVSEYEKGRTPNPCILCNRYFKFGKLSGKAKMLGASYTATGHYACIEKCGDEFFLRRGKDRNKDQSYVLYFMDQKMLSQTLFPLGDLTKQQVRELASDAGLLNARKKESQDICFVPDGNIRDALIRLSHYTPCSGVFTDRNGYVIGTHSGAAAYNVGQRRGTGISSDRRLYVIKKNIADNSVVLGPEEDLYSRSFDITDVSLTGMEKFIHDIHCTVMIRYNSREYDAVISPTGDNTAHVCASVGIRAVTPGQACVFYNGEYVLGGGIIK